MYVTGSAFSEDKVFVAAGTSVTVTVNTGSGAGRRLAIHCALHDVTIGHFPDTGVTLGSLGNMTPAGAQPTTLNSVTGRAYYIDIPDGTTGNQTLTVPLNQDFPADVDAIISGEVQAGIEPASALGDYTVTNGTDDNPAATIDSVTDDKVSFGFVARAFSPVNSAPVSSSYVERWDNVGVEELYTGGGDAVGAASVTPTALTNTGLAIRWMVFAWSNEAAASATQKEIGEGAVAGDSFDVRVTLAAETEGAEAGDAFEVLAETTAGIAEGARAGDAFDASGIATAGAIAEGALAGDSMAPAVETTVGIAEGALAGDSFTAETEQTRSISEGARAGDSFQVRVEVTLGISEGALAGFELGFVAEIDFPDQGAVAGDAFSATAQVVKSISEGARAGDSFFLRSGTGIHERALAGDAFEAVVQASASFSEGAIAGDAFTLNQLGPMTVEEGARAGDSFAVRVETVLAIAEGARAGDAYGRSAAALPFNIAVSLEPALRLAVDLVPEE